MASTADDPSVTGSTFASLIPAIRALCNLLTVSKVPGALIGGVAASLQGQARATEDVDALLRLDDRSLDRFLDLAVSQGFKSRIPDAVAFARRSAVLLLEHETSRVRVDLTIYACYTGCYRRCSMEAQYLSRDPEIMSGALCFKGTRVPVQNLFDYLEGSSSMEEFLEDFPTVTREAAVAVLEVAKERLFAHAPAA